MKKRFYWAFTAVILLLGLSLAVCTWAVGPSQAGANEQLAKEPVLVDEEGVWNPDYLSDVMDWFSDHFYLRQELVSANNWLTAHLFGTSGAENVILGREGWLYYADTLADYTGLAQLTDRELFCMTNNLALMAEYAENSGREFLFVIAPNKNSLYPQFMPDYGVTAQTRDAQRLYGLLEERQVPYGDLYSVFADTGEILYFAHDSHWNSVGAALAADVINAAFGTESSYYQGPWTETTAHAGDLYEMLYPAFTDPETDAVYGGTLDFTYQTSATKADSITLETAGRGTGRLLAYRDSFGNLLYPYLADSYASARFSRSTTYDLTLEADFILVELVERNLRYLITYVPVIESPVREIPVPGESSGTVSCGPVKGKAPEGMVCLKGTLEAEIAADTRVYVLCGGQAYEALLQKENGFTAYVPEGAEPEAVIYTAGGDYHLLTIE